MRYSNWENMQGKDREGDDEQDRASAGGEDLAKKCGVSRQTVSAIEKGDYNPTINLCIAICKALNKTLDELFWED